MNPHAARANLMTGRANRIYQFFSDSGAAMAEYEAGSRGEVYHRPTAEQTRSQLLDLIGDAQDLLAALDDGDCGGCGTTEGVVAGLCDGCVAAGAEVAS